MSGLTECEAKVRKWMNDLKTTRKCGITNAVTKAVNALEPADQQIIVSLITGEILGFCGDKEGRREAVNVINGCFDNFPVAVGAVCAGFREIVEFLTETLEECLLSFSTSSTDVSLSHKETVDLVHAISRVGTLVLKSQRGKDNVECQSFKRLSVTCSNFICNIDDIATDSKINMGMILWLLREVTVPSTESLKKFHDEFVETLSNEDDDYHRKFIKFVMAAAAVNLWESAVITAPQTEKYLNFFLNLCESYGNETGLVLMVSRCLQMLAKSSCFLSNDASQTDRFVACVMMLLEHSIGCVRHSARDLLQVVVKIPILQDAIQKSVLATTPDKKSFYLGLAALATVRDVRNLIKSVPHLPALVVSGLGDPTSVPHVILAIGNLALNDSLFRENERAWIDLWVMPLLHKIPHCLPIIAAEIEKLLLNLFKDKPDAIQHVVEHIEPDTFKWAMICFKIRNQIKGDGFQMFHQVYNTDEIETFLKHGDDDTRLGAFSLLVDGVITADSDLQKAVCFLEYNLNNHRPATRQKLVSLFRKLLTRVSSCCKVITRSKNPELSDEKLVSFFRELVDFCYRNIFAEANYNRLNTILNILDICRDVLDSNMQKRCGLFTAPRWAPLQIALCSTYEENQIIAAELAKRLSFTEMDLNDVGNLRQELRVAFGHIQALEPPRVLIGTYTLYVLLHVPNVSRVLGLNFSDSIEKPSEEPFILCIQILARYLNLQVNDARENAVKAARDAPMYGTMFAIRLMLKQLQEKHLEHDEAKTVLRELVGLSFKIADVVSPVVNNSSPEGHLPMDFQNIGSDESTPKGENSDAIRERFGGNVDAMIAAYKTADTAEEKLALAGGIRAYFDEELDKKLSEEREASLYDFNTEEWYKSLQGIEQSLAEYDCYYKFFQGHLPRIIEEPPVTAQALLLYSWRSMKEACLYLGDLVSKMPLKKMLECQILTEELLIKIGSKLRLLLSEIKHRGAFEQAEVGLSALCRALWDCPLPTLQHLPTEWLTEILEEIVRPPDQQTLKLTSTRRSAGLPFLVQAIITTQITSSYAPNSNILTRTMTVLLDIVDKRDGDLESRLHALNIMRALFQNAQLGEFVFPFISKALEFAIHGSRSETWSERNCSNMLFRALIVRIFGVSRSRNQLSKKNKMTSTTFFQRFPDLYNVLYEELLRADAVSSNGVKPEPSLYLVLLLMGRLYPTSSQDLQEIDLSRFLSLMGRCAGNPIMRIRVYAARALVPFVPAHKLKNEIVWRLDVLRKHTRANLRHGLLLQVIQLTNEAKNLNLKLDDVDWSIIYKTGMDQPFPVLQALYQLHLIVFDEPCLDSRFTENLDDVRQLVYTQPSPEQGIGLDACLATLVLLKLKCPKRDTSSWINLIRLKDCPVKAVQNTVLQYLYYTLTPHQKWDSDYEFSLLEDEVVRNLPEVEATLPDELWISYPGEEILSSVDDIEQRRLRILILARLIQLSKLPHHDPFSGGLALLSLFTQNWDPKTHFTNVADCLNKKHQRVVLNESLLARVVVRMESLLNGDKNCRLAVASIFSIAKEFLTPSVNIDQFGLEYRKYWMILFRLLIDEDEDVRIASLETVIEISLKLKILSKKRSMTALAGQELLIQCYANTACSTSGLGIDLLLFALLTVQPPEEDTSPTDFMEIFKKGNPNPFSEPMALFSLFTKAARPHLTDLEKTFPAGADAYVYNQLSPHFALNGRRMKLFTTPSYLFSELQRLDPPDNADNLVFWCQVRELLTLLPRHNTVLQERIGNGPPAAVDPIELTIDLD